MSEIKISVVVPVYNAEMFLEKSLNSLMEQNMKNIEFVCIDDGSTDNSWKILKSYADRDNRFKILHKENEGVSIARNKGLDYAEGEYVMFLDADDWYSHDACTRAYELVREAKVDVAVFAMEKEFANHSEYYGALGKNYRIFSEEECHKIHRTLVGLIDDECRRILEFDYLAEVYLKIYRRDIIEENHIRFYDIRKIGCFEDGFFNVQYFAYVSSMTYSPEVLYHYRKTNEASITTRYREQLDLQWQHLFEVLEKYVNEVHNIRKSEFDRALNNRIAFAIFGLGLNAIAEKAPLEKKYKNVSRIVHNKAFARRFKANELKAMPLPFRVFFSCACKKWTFVVFLLLVLMECVRSKKRGK